MKIIAINEFSPSLLCQQLTNGAFTASTNPHHNDATTGHNDSLKPNLRVIAFLKFTSKYGFILFMLWVTCYR
ncbi:Uncharacterised protein [Vibrio cholerae]|uniref:Uncharacterized protein n=1 Tax=Vibrio cholerae TaxID=666 RepID=A0A655Z5T4_VIBCL|nr:Uncharacterised protein [Vibrio cholerae]